MSRHVLAATVIIQPPGGTQALEMDVMGLPMTEQGMLHRDRFRIRCRECCINFCWLCGEQPYHMGMTCEQYSAWNRHVRAAASLIIIVIICALS